MRLPDIRPDRKAMLDIAVKELNRGDYPFQAEHNGERLLVRWRWKDADVFGITHVACETQEFCYVVHLNDDCTYYGHDTDNGSIARGDVSREGRLMKTAFIGTEIRFHKETAFGRDKDGTGIKTWKFSTEEIHGAVKKVFWDNGWEFRQPMISWVKIEHGAGATFRVVGLLFMAVAAFLLGIFALTGIHPAALLIPSAILLIGSWSFLAGKGVFKFPVFSMKGGLIFIGIFFVIIYLAVFLFLGVMFLNGGIQ